MFIIVILKKIQCDMLDNGKSIIRPPSKNLAIVVHMNINSIFSVRGQEILVGDAA